MENNWAEENLQVIRTLMERSSVYRRALAPVMTFTGVVGIIAAVAGWRSVGASTRGFAEYWMAVSLVAIAGNFLLVRRQALRDSEPFWSPPTRRVSQAMLPPLSAGFAFGLFFILLPANPDASEGALAMPEVWMMLYGCALHAAGFFMPRSIKLLGWAFVLCGTAFLLSMSPLIGFSPQPECGHIFMGVTFGAGHLAYGIYLYFTERTKK